MRGAKRGRGSTRAAARVPVAEDATASSDVVTEEDEDVKVKRLRRESKEKLTRLATHIAKCQLPVLKGTSSNKCLTLEIDPEVSSVLLDICYAFVETTSQVASRHAAQR